MNISSAGMEATPPRCASDIVVRLVRQKQVKRQPLVTLSLGTGISNDEYLERQHPK